MKRIRFHKMTFHCKFCGSEMKTSSTGYLSNPFCSDCYEQRLEASGAIDLRDNHRIVDAGNGYVQIVPIDPTKKFKASKK
ncbi:hypothetical protein PP175_28400 (plasmid) [Aneurinibacillus sp. Ricciae_BoGa-3]|uniref:hypothetical protein n=1 Tax=Aneurinibacillus sp. Ricciae_BoGa-3 TaxID=3022697 RepID=UPI00233FF89F|nr:hypothetical protein [Aneurinibacillus sp. Ricciae_BoGa-3]WCK57113.1 hypothetical protein PP175_28400 [Aneurinibacillus sp. Ricciae_BoGa-3]